MSPAERCALLNVGNQLPSVVTAGRPSSAKNYTTTLGLNKRAGADLNRRVGVLTAILSRLLLGNAYRSMEGHEPPLFELLPEVHSLSADITTEWRVMPTFFLSVLGENIQSVFVWSLARRCTLLQ